MPLAGVGRAPSLLPKTAGFFPKHCWEPRRSTVGECQSRLGEMYPVCITSPMQACCIYAVIFQLVSRKCLYAQLQTADSRELLVFISYYYCCFDEEGGRASCHLLLMACGSDASRSRSRSTWHLASTICGGSKATDGLVLGASPNGTGFMTFPACYGLFLELLWHGKRAACWDHPPWQC